MKVTDFQATPLHHALEYLLDSRVGIIESLEEVPRQPGAPAFFYFFAKACDTGAFCQQSNFSDTGGASIYRDVAMGKAIGEAVERYCSAIFVADECPLSSYRSAGFPCVPPDAFALYSSAQYDSAGFPFAPFNNETLLHWTPARDLVTGGTYYVPASMVYVPYFHDHDSEEQPIGQSISTGLACHCSYTEAAVSAICEVIERDAFTIAWQAMIEPPQIRLNSLSDLNRDLVSRIEVTGGSVRLLNITMDNGIPTILAVVKRSSPESPALVFAASSHPDPEQATRKSLEEVVYTGVLAQHLKTNRPSIIAHPLHETVTDQDAHVRFYGDHENAELADFMFRSSEWIQFRDIPSPSTGTPETDLEMLVKKLSSIGHETLIADLTTPDIAEIGLTVVRALVPGFHPLFLGHRIRGLGGARLWTIPQKLGYKGINRQNGDNSAPHPYP